jgi:RNA polymerase sigma factor (TIGR02999 family)
MFDESPVGPLIKSADKGAPASQQALFSELYDQLKRVAQHELRKNGGGLTLGASTLLHETYLKLSKREGLAFPDRPRFLAYASRAMRGLVIDYARRKRAQKRGSGFEFTELPTDVGGTATNAAELERLSEAIDQLAVLDADLAQLVDLKYFCGYSVADIAVLRGMSERTVMRDWEKARILLHRFLRE